MSFDPNDLQPKKSYRGEIMLAIIIFLLSLSAKAATVVSFSPNGLCQQMTVNLIDGATETVDAAVYSINNIAIVEAYERAKKRGVVVRILTDHVEAGSNRDVTLRLAKDHLGGFRLHSVTRIMHDKFVIADKKKMITGSFNETEPAQKLNSENCLTSDDLDLVKQYDTEFNFVLWEKNTQVKSDEHLKAIKIKDKEEAEGK
jgi:phosphatidylserine/phosphatidylglycerophosphate/cardiolipin synthase-like enzyme